MLLLLTRVNVIVWRRLASEQVLPGVAVFVCDECGIEGQLDPLHRVLLPTTEEEWHLAPDARGLEHLPFLGQASAKQIQRVRRTVDDIWNGVKEDASSSQHPLQLPQLPQLPRLPDGWKMGIDPNSGHPYYANPSTGETQWHPPEGTVMFNPSAEQIAEQVSQIAAAQNSLHQQQEQATQAAQQAAAAQIAAPDRAGASSTSSPSMELPGDVYDAAYGGDTAVVEAWLDGGGHVDARLNEEGGAEGTLLLAATCVHPTRTHSPMIELLLRRGAAVDLQNQIGWTALMGASFEGNLAVARRLLQANANVHLQNHNDNTALTIARQRAAAGVPASAEIVSLLYEAGAGSASGGSSSGTSSGIDSLADLFAHINTLHPGSAAIVRMSDVEEND